MYTTKIYVAYLWFTHFITGFSFSILTVTSYLSWHYYCPFIIHRPIYKILRRTICQFSNMFMHMFENLLLSKHTLENSCTTLL